MAGAGKKILIGCGAGCGALVLLIIVLSVSGAMWVKGTMDGFDSAIENRGLLDERFGDLDEFTPAPDGAVPAERMELFLTVRERTERPRDRIAKAFSGIPLTKEQAHELDDKPFGEKMAKIFGITKSAFGLAGSLGDFFEARNTALLDSGMGMGEYTYIYSVVYHSWLEHPPTEGPDARSARSGHGGREDIGAALGEATLPSVRDALRGMLRNQLASLADTDDAAWRQAVTAEIEALADDRARTLWHGSLPPAIAASLEPYRERLTATYSAATNPLELARNEKNGKWSVTMD